MEWIQVQAEMEALIQLVDGGDGALADAGNSAGDNPALYDLAIAKTLMGLKNGKSYELEGETIIDPPVTIMEKIAKGVCFREKMAMDRANLELKRVCRKMDGVKTKISALQSINKQHEQMAKSPPPRR